MAKLFATSDQHFTHFNILKYANRPFELSDKGVKDCINTIVNKHNEIVSDEDIVLHIGDLGHGRHQSEEIIKFIINSHKGKKILLKGNHDNFSDEFYNSIFDSVGTYLIQGEYFFCHYPCYGKGCNDEEKKLIDIFKNSGCSIIVHGHIHNKNPDCYDDGIKRINVSVDYEVNDFYPVQINTSF
jgi:calcineurin-like phosphoesterase family protein